MMFYLGTASVGTFVDVTVGVQVIIAAVLGGRRTILGGAIGAIFLIGAGRVAAPARRSLPPSSSPPWRWSWCWSFPGGLIGLLAARGRRA